MFDDVTGAARRRRRDDDAQYHIGRRQGQPYANEQMQSPALNGACTHCNAGWSVGCMVQPGNTFYVNALHGRITDKHERKHIVKEALASFEHAGPAEKHHSEI